MVSTAAPVFSVRLKNDNALSSVSSSDCLAFRYRQTSGNGGTPRETQSHPDPWFFRETEGVSHRQGQVQPNKVSHQIIQHCTFWKKNWDRGKTKSLYKLARCVFQSHYQECWIANIVSESGGRDGCQDVRYWCLYQCAWKLEGQVPLYVSEKDFSIDAFKCIVWKLCCSSDVSLLTEGTAAILIWMWGISVSLPLLPSAGMQQAIPWSAVPTVPPMSAVLGSNSMVGPGKRSLLCSTVEAMWMIGVHFFPWHAAFSSDYRVCFLLQLAVQSLLKIHK